MTTNPELKWPEAYTIGPLQGGVMYESSPTRIMWQFGTVENIDMSDLDPSTHTIANPLIKRITGFTDQNVFIEIRFWVEEYQADPQTTVEYVKGEFFIHKSSGYDDLGTITGIMLGNWYIYSNVNYVKTHGIKVAIMTDYRSMGIPVDGITPAYNVKFLIFNPALGIVEYPDYTVATAFDNVVNGALLTEVDREDPEKVVQSTGVYSGGCLYHGNIEGSYFSSIGSIFDLSYFTGMDPSTTDPTNPENPPQDDDPSGEDGGDGDVDPTSDPIDFPDLPSGGTLASGSVKVFAVSNLHLIAIFQKLWSTSIFDIATFQKLVEAPLDSLISLECVPITPSTSGSADVLLGNFDTGVDAPVVDKQYYTLDFGTLDVKKYWGNALDFSPYTKVAIYLPCIGIRDLDVDDVMGKTLHVKYNYDLLNGVFTAQIKCGQSVLYKFPGEVKETIPVTARVKDAMQRLIMGGLTAAMATTGAGLAAAAITSAVNVAMSKTSVSRSGSMSASVGLLDDFVPYIIIHRPKQSLPDNFRAFKGYPSNISAQLGSLQGYTEVEYIHLTGIDGATDTELDEIESLLKSGVII